MVKFNSSMDDRSNGPKSGLNWTRPLGGIGYLCITSLSKDVTLISSQRAPVLETLHFPHCFSALILLLLKVSPKIYPQTLLPQIKPVVSFVIHHWCAKEDTFFLSFLHTWGLLTLSKFFFFGLNGSHLFTLSSQALFPRPLVIVIALLKIFSERPTPSWNTFSETGNTMPVGSFPFLGRPDFTGLTSCSSFYVISHFLCLFCNSGKYFTTMQKLKHWCSALGLFRSTKHCLAYLPEFVSLIIIAQYFSSCTTLRTTGY